MLTGSAVNFLLRFLPLLGGVLGAGGGAIVAGSAWTEPLKIALFTAAATLGGVLTGTLISHWLNVQIRQKARVYFEALCEPDVYVRTAGGGPEFLPPEPIDQFCLHVVEVVRGALSRLGREVAAAQQSRAAMELKIRRAAEQARYAELALDAVPYPIFLLAGRCQLLLANRAARELFGWEGASFGKSVDEIIGQQELAAFLAAEWRRSSGATKTEEIQLPLPGGRSESFHCRVVKFRMTDFYASPPEAALTPPRGGSVGGDDGTGRHNGDGQRTAEELACHGITAAGAGPCRNQAAGRLMQEESAWRAMAVVLEPRIDLRAMRAQEAAFLSAVSHEMKTPLASIRAYAELLADAGADDPDTRESFLAVINTQVDRLQRLVKNLLDLARIEAGILQVNKGTHSLNEILEEAAGVVRPAAEEKSIELLTDLSPLFLPVSVDRDLLLQAVINLLSNAVKYTPVGGRVILRSRLDDTEAVIQVEDTGVGLTPEECRRIFDRFYRVKRNEQMAEGTGLGLALVKSIVEDLHAGRISVDSIVDKGTTFTIRLPFCQALATA